jgi:hypothetical protein
VALRLRAAARLALSAAGVTRRESSHSPPASLSRYALRREVRVTVRVRRTRAAAAAAACQSRGQCLGLIGLAMVTVVLLKASADRDP